MKITQEMDVSPKSGNMGSKELTVGASLAQLAIDNGENETINGQGSVTRGRISLLQAVRAQVELSAIAFLLSAFRRTGPSTCKAGPEDIKMDISWPTNVRHVTHVTFDRFNGFLGLPVEFEMEVPKRAPSASARVFGVSPESMQCSYDRQRNSVPTILLSLQEELYKQDGLKAEGIFRINAENSQEERVRDQLNKGVVPPGIDMHCLACLIKAWFRELPKGVLDDLSPDQVMQCHTEVECLELISKLPPMARALLDWAINLMADVVQMEQFNKMNAHNIAMVFAPNMTQMSDPLTALMHAVQVMNLLKTLIIKTLKDRDGSMEEVHIGEPQSVKQHINMVGTSRKVEQSICAHPEEELVSSNRRPSVDSHVVNTEGSDDWGGTLMSGLESNCDAPNNPSDSQEQLSNTKQSSHTEIHTMDSACNAVSELDTDATSRTPQWLMAALAEKRKPMTFPSASAEKQSTCRLSAKRERKNLVGSKRQKERMLVVGVQRECQKNK